jgi:TIR domain
VVSVDNLPCSKPGALADRTRPEMNDIFISYSREDHPTARQLADMLERMGWTVWWDTRLKAGEIWDETIERELAAARCVVVLWSKSSVEKRWVREEARRAEARQSLVPALIEQVDIPFGFGLVQAENLTGWSGDPLHPGLKRLVAVISERLQTQHSPDTTERLNYREAPLATGEAERSKIPHIDFDGRGFFSLMNVRFGKPQGHLEVLEFEIKVDRQPPCVKNRVKLHTLPFTPSGAQMLLGAISGGYVVSQGQNYIMAVRFPNFSEAGTIKAWLECDPFIF